MKSLQVITAVAVSSAALLLGCGKGSPSSAASSSAAASSGLSVKEQCDALDKANTTWADKVSNRKDTNDAAKDAQGTANDVAAWSAAIGKLSIDDPELKKLVIQEQTVLKDESASLKDLVTLMGKMDAKASPDEKALDAMQKQMDALSKKQDASQAQSDAIDKKVETYCSDKL